MQTDWRSQCHRWPRTTLVLAFVAWKSLLFGIAALSPGTGYDTSTALLAPFASPLDKLVRWDAIYFVQIARRGYVFEQEWAFGAGWTKVLALLASYGCSSHDEVSANVIALIGVLVAHSSHLASTLILYHLSINVFDGFENVHTLALLTALLHVFTPAGIFLSAPYAEAPFAALQVLGLWLYALAQPRPEIVKEHPSTRKHSLSVMPLLAMLCSGAAIGLSVTLRSNGLFAGAIFAIDVIDELRMGVQNPSINRLFQMIAILTAGLLVGLGFALPQYFAWQRYCIVAEHTRRPWCDALVPSIYQFVQQHYWNVGFLRYWTVSNVPLFLLATPMLLMLAASGVWAFSFSVSDSVVSGNSISRSRESLAGSKQNDTAPASSDQRRPDSRESDERLQLRTTELLQRMAVPQLLLVLLAATTYHVQIITRLSSAYPVWHWWLAWSMLQGPSADRPAWLPSHAVQKLAMQFLIMYAIIQAGLFASFLPPA